MVTAVDNLYDARHINLIIDALACSEENALDYVARSHADCCQALASEMAGVAALDDLLNTWEQTKALAMLNLE